MESNPRLSVADRDCIVLATQHRARLMADDAAIRSVARNLGMPLGGTFHAPFELIDRQLIPSDGGVSYLDRLVDLG